MATSAIIAKENPDTGRIRAITVHSDGYPESVGLRLVNQYSDDDKVDGLLDLGSLSSLGDDLATTVAHHRDRRGTYVAPKMMKSPDDLTNLDGNHYYLYLHANGHWYMATPQRRGSWQLVRGNNPPSPYEMDGIKETLIRLQLGTDFVRLQQLRLADDLINRTDAQDVAGDLRDVVHDYQQNDRGAPGMDATGPAGPPRAMLPRVATQRRGRGDLRR